MTPAHRSPLERATVEALVQAFYADVRADPLLGPVFERFVHRGWPAHLRLMADFWCTVLRVQRCFSGDVYQPHMALEGVEPEHLFRWLRLWFDHTQRQLPPEYAQRAQSVALGMGRVMHLGWFGSMPAASALREQVLAFSGSMPFRVESDTFFSARLAAADSVASA